MLSDAPKVQIHVPAAAMLETTRNTNLQPANPVLDIDTLGLSP